ncbi:MAG: GTP cyclohydrolase I FolE [Pseudomonadota bacterium]
MCDNPTKKQAEEAVRTLISWAGDDPKREGLLETPMRVTRAYQEYFKGYKIDPTKELQKSFEENEGYNDMVMLRNISFSSHCEHHIAPIIGVAHIAYMPNKKVVGISKLARVVEIFAKRLQTQERMTSQIAKCIRDALGAAGVAVLIEAEHHCMSTRGVHKPGVKTLTKELHGVFLTDQNLKNEWLSFMRGTTHGTMV